MPSLRQSVKRLRDRWILPPSGTVSVNDLIQRFQPTQSGSLRSLLLTMNVLADVAEPVGGSTHPYYRRPKHTHHDATRIASNTDYIDLRNVHLPPFGVSNPVAEAAGLFDSRAAAAVSAATGLENGVQVFPSGNPETGSAELLEKKDYGDKAPTIFIPTAKCLAALAYPDFFPNVPANFFPHLRADRLRGMVSEAILAASPGWCGSFGPGVDGTIDVSDLFGKHEEGNYDMSQMHLLQIAYRYYDQLSAEAQERLIGLLLAAGRIRRPNQADIFTSGGAPNDWSRVGFIEVPLPVIGDLLGIHVKVKRIGETENHILTIHTARYLTNQLLYQRDHDPSHDNRRNGSEDAPSCTELMLRLLRNILRDDFSEYNAKNYQNETRSALLNLCSYAYDHEVRLGARMVLDYISAHIAVSSNDLRRMVPFRRRNEGKNVTRNADDYMEVGLLDTSLGADPMTQRFAILAGNTRVYETNEVKPGDRPRPREWIIATYGGNGNEAVVDALSDYRLPPSIHDLFMNDLHRRFFQRLHRVPQDNVDETGRNCKNDEIYAGSPSYLITAGGSPSTYAIDPHVAGVVAGDQAQQLGVAVTTSFMPTRISEGNPGTGMGAKDLIQFSSFSDKPGMVANYGVAPDFACGFTMYTPDWCSHPRNGPDDRHGNFRFVDQGSNGDGPGFYLAIYDAGDGLVAMEAFDTWLHPRALNFEQFKAKVLEKNGNMNLKTNVEAEYTTLNGNHLRFIIGMGDQGAFSSSEKILSIEYATGPSADPMDGKGDAGNVTDQFLRGTVMNSTAEGVVEITNHFLGTKIILDMSDPSRPRRTSETGEVEEAGSNHEVWVDFAWTGPNEGDFFRPFNTITAAAAAVANGGVIKIMPGWTTEKPFFQTNKRIRLNAPIGGVTFGVR
jgi:hypothetical protein